MQDRISFIREQEKNYHEAFYDANELFQEGTWLHRPVKTVMDALSRLDWTDGMAVLDLGCGVGQNSIPIARAIKPGRDSRVVCVDILESAIRRLVDHSEQHNVRSMIEPHVSDISSFCITPDTYDYVVAVSSLEHVHSEAALDKVLSDIAHGTKTGGIVCIIMNANVREYETSTGERLEAMVEVALSLDLTQSKLHQAYHDWERITETVKPLSFDIHRDAKKVTLQTDAVTFVARKSHR